MHQVVELLNIFLSLVYRNAKTPKDRDILSIIFFGWLGCICGIIIMATGPYLVYSIELLTNTVETLIKVLENPVANQFLLSQEYLQMPIFLGSEVKMFALLIILMVITFFIAMTNKKSNVKTILITITMFLTTFLFVPETRIVFLLLFSLFLICCFFVPLGSERYFNFIKLSKYFFLMLKPRKKKVRLISFILLYFISLLAFAFTLQIQFPTLSIGILLILHLSIIILIWFNSSDDKIINILKKLIIYILIIPIVLINNNILEADLLFVVPVLMSVFFAIERNISLVKEVKNIIINENLLYLIDEINDYTKLLSQRMILPLNNHVNEDTLLRQIVIYYKLEDTKVNSLIQTYFAERYKSQIKLVKTIQYFHNSNDKIPMDQREAFIREIMDSEGEIYLFPIIEEFAFTLFVQNKYEESSKSLIENFMYLSDDGKYLLYRTFIELGDEKRATSVKKEITCYFETEQKMLELLEQYK